MEQKGRGNSKSKESRWMLCNNNEGRQKSHEQGKGSEQLQKARASRRSIPKFKNSADRNATVLP